MSGKIIIHPLHAGIEMTEHLFITGTVPQFVEEENLHRERGSVKNKGIFLVVFCGKICVEILHSTAVIQVKQSKSDEAGIPGVKTVPEASGRVVSHKRTIASDGVNNVCHDD